MYPKQKPYVVFLLFIISGAFGVIYMDVSNYANNAFPFERDVKTNYMYAQNALPDLNSTLLYLHTDLEWEEEHYGPYFEPFDGHVIMLEEIIRIDRKNDAQQWVNVWQEEK
jgi:hypothetical protein